MSWPSTRPGKRRGFVENYVPPGREPRLEVPGTQTQPGWGGVAFFSTSTPVTSIAASFTVPAVTGDAGAICSIWVGIGNVMQTGIYTTYNTGYSGNNNPGQPWSWFFSGAGCYALWDESVYTVAAGDSMSLGFGISGGNWQSTQTNHTAGWTYTANTPIQAVGIPNASWQYPYNTAEVIIEKEGSSDLPNYGSLTFTGISMVPAIDTSNINYITTVNASTDQTPGTYSGGSFTMTWNNYR